MPEQSDGFDENFDLKKATAPGIAALKHLWAPILLMQALSALLVISYYHFPQVAQATEGIQHAKDKGGILFVIAAGFAAGGILPTLAKLATGKTDKNFAADLLFNGLVYAIVAIEVDALYRTQAILFGRGIDPATLIKKNLLDMAIFSPFLSMPSAVGLFEWRKAHFSFAALRREFSFRFFKQKIIVALIPLWAFWIPMLFCVYALPQNLQFPFAMIGEASWCMLFVFIATQE